MNISLTPYFEEWVQKKVESGRYNNASEVVREALRYLEEREQIREAKLRDLRQAIEDGINSGEPQPLGDFETLLKDVRAYRATKLKATLQKV